MKVVVFIAVEISSLVTTTCLKVILRRYGVWWEKLGGAATQKNNERVDLSQGNLRLNCELYFADVNSSMDNCKCVITCYPLPRNWFSLYQ